MELLYQDKRICVCLKPPGVVSTDQPGGMPELVRSALGTPCVKTVHRLDQVVGGVMVFARSAAAASILSAQVRDGRFGKAYLAVVHGAPHSAEGTYTDLLLRNREERKTYVVGEPGPGVQEAVLDYRVLEQREGLSLLHVTLRTGRTHQIRAQFSSRGLPLVGDRKYGNGDDGCDIALWSHRLDFTHPETGEPMTFSALPPQTWPWTLFEACAPEENRL